MDCHVATLLAMTELLVYASKVKQFIFAIQNSKLSIHNFYERIIITNIVSFIIMFAG